jgi:hypothetical protein
MKIHPLRIGRTKVPFGQFYGGLHGFSLREFAADKDHFIWVPIHAYLIEHPAAGPVLVDTGSARSRSHTSTTTAVRSWST